VTTPLVRMPNPALAPGLAGAAGDAQAKQRRTALHECAGRRNRRPGRCQNSKPSHLIPPWSLDGRARATRAPESSHTGRWGFAREGASPWGTRCGLSPFWLVTETARSTSAGLLRVLSRNLARAGQDIRLEIQCRDIGTPPRIQPCRRSTPEHDMHVGEAQRRGRRHPLAGRPRDSGSRWIPKKSPVAPA